MRLLTTRCQILNPLLGNTYNLNMYLYESIQNMTLSNIDCTLLQIKWYFFGELRENK